jgi:murein DD-endopeptidase MepM/ murein hydrolase activator NlpD
VSLAGLLRRLPGLERLPWPGRGSRPGSPAPRDAWTLEIQIHPSDIRKRVVYLFLSRAQVTSWCILFLLFGGFLLTGMAVAPSVIGGWINRGEYDVLVAERTRQGERLQELLDGLDHLDQEAAQLDLRMQKISLAYGLRTPRGRDGAALPAVASPGSLYSGAVARGNREREQIHRQIGKLNAFLAAAQEFERANPEPVRTTPSLCPLRGGEMVLISPFGRRPNPITHATEIHSGLDLAARVGTPVRAPADGTVLFAGQFSQGRSATWWRFGNLVIVRHGDRFVTIYGHCDTVGVRVGQAVRRGDVLATVGQTGWSVSPHLHYEIRRRTELHGYVPVEPRIYILDQRWPNEERYLAQVRAQMRAQARRGRAPEPFEPLPVVLR